MENMRTLISLVVLFYWKNEGRVCFSCFLVLFSPITIKFLKTLDFYVLQHVFVKMFIFIKKTLKLAYVENQQLVFFLANFSKKSGNNVWSEYKKSLPLHPQSRGTPLESAKERVL